MTATWLGVTSALSTSACCAVEQGGPAPRLLRAHAHRDQQHAVPLFDSLRHGFTSLEVDVWHVDGELLVAHDEDELDSARSLRSLYLDPLAGLARAGSLPCRGLMLMVDVKTDGPSGAAAVSELLASYPALRRPGAAGSRAGRPVRVLLTGSVRPEMVAAPVDGSVSVDGRLGDLGRGWPRSLVPLVSDDWARHFRWDGTGAMPELERAELRRWARQAVAEGRTLRFWGTPDTPGPAREAVWGELLGAGVGLVNTDDLCGLAAVLTPARMGRLVPA